MLDQSADNEDLKQGSKVELPFWMVPTLHAKKIITFEIPRHYKVNYRQTIKASFRFKFLKSLAKLTTTFFLLLLYYRQILQADSIVVDLHKWGPYFYDLGLHVANLGLTDSPDIKSSLVKVDYFY